MASCVISGTFKDPSDTAISGVTVTFRITRGTTNSSASVFYLPKDIVATSASDGTWSITLSQGISGMVQVLYTANSLSPSHQLNYSITVPATGTATFNSLAIEV